MSEQKNTMWTRIRGNTSRDPILLGRKISPEWLQEQVRLIEFSFEGQLFDAFSTLLNAAKQEKKNLPITSLRTALIAGIDRIVRLDRDLGLLPDDGGKFGCAVSMFPDIDDDDTYIGCTNWLSMEFSIDDNDTYSGCTNWLLSSLQ